MGTHPKLPGVSQSCGPHSPYLCHECDLECAGHLPPEGSHLLQEARLPELGLGQPGVPRKVVVEGEGQDQGLCLRVVFPCGEKSLASRPRGLPNTPTP